MKKTILAAGILIFASMVQAEVIAWRVDLGAENSTYETAQLFATKVTTGEYWKDGSISAQETQKIEKYDNTYGVVKRTTALGSTIDNTYSFFVNLYAFDGITVVGYSALKSWGDLVTQGSLGSGVPSLPATAWNAVPEPTSMALLAMGVSALLLRRKRVA